MQAAETERLIRSIVPGNGAWTMERLEEGLVNESYRVIRDGRAYSLRIDAATPGGPPEWLGLDRVWEARVLELAGRMQLAPATEYYDADRGILLQSWVAGSIWTADEINRPSNIGRIADLLRQIHALVPLPPLRTMSAADWIVHYAAAMAREKLAMPEKGLLAAARGHLRRLAELPATVRVLCHSDLQTFNLLDSGQVLTVLDWEYAHVTDPLWDLAGWISNNDLGCEPAGRLLFDYLGDAPTAGQAERLWRLAWLYDYVCLLWGALYVNYEERLLEGPVAARSRSLAARLKFRHTNGLW